MNIKKVLSVVFIILGAIIGGGLGTGRELATFFCCFGSHFWIPCLITILTFIILIILISKINFTNANKKIQFAFFCFRLIIASTMISALKEICAFVPNSTFIYIILLITCFLLLFVNFNGISKIFNIIIPFVFMGLMLIAIFSIITTKHSILTCETNILKFFINGSIYSALNLFLLLFVVKKGLLNCNQKETNLVIIIVSTLLAILLITLSIAIIYSNNAFSTIPMLEMALNLSNSLLIPIVICIILAIISTFIGIGFDLTSYLYETIKIRNKFVSNSIIFAFCILVSNLGLDYLINYGYKSLGALALIYFIFVFIKQKITRNKASDSFKVLSSSFINNFFYK